MDTAMSAPAPATTPRLLPPPEDRLYATFQDLHDDLKAWGRAQGFAMVIDSSCNRDASGLYRRYNLSCSKGGKGYTKKGTGQRQGNSHKVGCQMRVKCMQNRAWPWNDRWHIMVLEGKHNHGPFTGGPGEAVPPQFRKIEPDGIRWLLIMHREAKCTLRQLTIGLRVSFGDKYQYVKKSDVSNMLAKIKRGEEKEIASRPPGAPPLAPGAMTAFTAAVLTPEVPPQRPGGVPFELVPQTHQPDPAPQFQTQPGSHFPNHQPMYPQPQHRQPQGTQPPQVHPQQPLPQAGHPQHLPHTNPQHPQTQPQQGQAQTQPVPRWQTPRTAANYAPQQSTYQPTIQPPQGQTPGAGATNQQPASGYQPASGNPQAYPQAPAQAAAPPPVTPTTPVPPPTAGQPLMTFSPVSEDSDGSGDEEEEEESEEE